MEADERRTGRAVAHRPSTEPTVQPSRPAPAAAPTPTRLGARLQRAHAIADLRRQAARRLPKAVFDFIDGGAEDERTLRDNVEAFDDWMLMPRVGIDVATRDLSRSILGYRASLPIMMAPTGLAGFFWPDGEVAGAQAAARAGIPYCLSTNSVGSIEHVAEGARRASAGSSSTSCATGSGCRRSCAARPPRATGCCASPSTSRCRAGASATCATPSPCR